MAVTTGAMRSRPPLRQAIVESPIMALPGWPKAGESAALEAARSSSRGSGLGAQWAGPSTPGSAELP
jgi:hypothetical protein